MKYLKQTITLLLLSAFFQLNAQDECNNLFPFDDGISFEITHYDKKGKLESVVNHRVEELNPEDVGWSAKVKGAVTDDKGEEVTELDYLVYCRDGQLEVDFSSMVAPGFMNQAYNMNTSVSGDDVAFPQDMSVGQELPDAELAIELQAGDKTVMTLRFWMQDRKVEAQETITTPAGTFDCFKISHTFETKALFTSTYSITEWYAVGVGAVRSETYNKKGKLIGSSELTKFEKG
jgi:hypothetical protein